MLTIFARYFKKFYPVFFIYTIKITNATRRGWNFQVPKQNRSNTLQFTRCFFTSFAILTPWIEGVRRVASFTPPKLFKWSLRTEGLSQLEIFLVEKDKNSSWNNVYFFIVEADLEHLYIIDNIEATVPSVCPHIPPTFQGKLHFYNYNRWPALFHQIIGDMP